MVSPGVKHWHGGTATTAMTYIAIAEEKDTSPVTWLEKVTDEQYAGTAAPTRAGHGRITISRNSARESRSRGDTFTGTVRSETLFQPEDGSQVYASYVTFNPGARTDWHTHPVGQTLLVTYGRGMVQESGQPTRHIEAGDIVWFPAGLKHRHGATPGCAMTHIAIAESAHGSAVTWLEKVLDSEYTG